MKKTYFNHDSSARLDIRIIKLRATLGYEGYGIFWAVLELLFSEENKICTSQYDIIAFGLQCDADKLRSVIEDFDLFVIDDGCFYSRRLNKHIEEINTKSVKAKENANKRWNKQSQCDRNASKSISKSISKVNKSKIDDRVSAFKNAVHNLDFMDKDDKQDFYLYWSELTKSQTNPRMRWETERTWSLNLRAKRWIKNGFNKQKKTYPDYYDGQLMRKMDESAKKEYENHLKTLGYTISYNPNSGAKWVKK